MGYPGTFAQTRGDHPAVVMARSGEVVTYRELDERSNRLAHLLRAAGLGRGDHLALFCENNARFMEVVWAGLRSGIYVTAINSHLTAPEVAYIVRDCEATALVSSQALAEVAAGLTGEHDVADVRVRLMIDGAIDGWERYEDAIAEYPATPIDDESHGTPMLYSSGTTGRPKGIRRPMIEGHPSEMDPRSVAFATIYGYDADMVYLSPAPMYHAAPLAFSTIVHRYGGTVLIMERFDPAEALELIERYRVTHSQWVPTMFVRMLKLDESERARHDLSSLRYAIHAAAPCPVPVKQQMIEWWGPILYEYYAGTEGNGATQINSEEWLRKPGSVGRVRAGAIHIVDGEGNELPPGEVGSIYFSGGGSFEYHNDPEKTAGAHLNDWSTLGDVGYLDDEGYLFLSDRRADLIICGGVNIYPREIEDVLVTHPKVADVAVFGIPDDDLGEVVQAVVQPIAGVDGDDALGAELRAWLDERLAKFKRPRAIDFEAELPRLPTGKLYKRLLRDRYRGETKPATIV
ncbi:MAG: AMP-binding protein [Actinomycetota bacterium]|nr:AMP-binding protein [Actinomycetota bacterium]